MDIQRPRNGLSLCAGAGGLDLGFMLAEPGFKTVCYVEWDEYAQRCLIAAQRAGYFHPAPIWDNCATFDGRPFNGSIDTILAGYPCQPFSYAGQRKGAKDERHLWPDIARIIREIEPAWVLLENVNGHVTLGAEAVLRELREMGFTPAVGLFTAAEVGAPHERKRWFCLAHSDRNARKFADCGQPDTGPDRRYNAGRSGGKDVENPGRSQRRPVDTSRNNANGTNARRQENPSRIEKSGENVVNPAIAGLQKPRITGRESGQAENGSGLDNRFERSSEQLADTNRTRLEGRKRPGSHDERHRTATLGSTAKCRGVPIHPPGPNDHAAWASILASHPDIAPAVSLGDVKRAANHFAQMVEKGELAETEAQSRICGMVAVLAERSRALKLLGNGVHPLGAANAIRALGIAHGLWPVDMGAITETETDAN